MEHPAPEVSPVIAGPDIEALVVTDPRSISEAAAAVHCPKDPLITNGAPVLGVSVLLVSAYDLKHLSPQILLLFVTADDLKQDLGDILLLFVSADDLKHLLPQILLLFVTADNITRPIGTGRTCNRNTFVNLPQ